MLLEARSSLIPAIAISEVPDDYKHVTRTKGKLKARLAQLGPAGGVVEFTGSVLDDREVWFYVYGAYSVNFEVVDDEKFDDKALFAWLKPTIMGLVSDVMSRSFVVVSSPWPTGLQIDRSTKPDFIDDEQAS